jgi:hypothetical protein
MGFMPTAPLRKPITAPNRSPCDDPFGLDEIGQKKSAKEIGDASTGDQTLSAPDALAIWVAMKSISPGDRQS